MAPGPTTSIVPCSLSGPSQRTCETGYRSLQRQGPHSRPLVPEDHPWDLPRIVVQPHCSLQLLALSWPTGFSTTLSA